MRGRICVPRTRTTDSQAVARNFDVLSKYFYCIYCCCEPGGRNCDVIGFGIRMWASATFVHRRLLSSDQSHASRTQRKLPLWCSCFHRPVQHSRAVSTLHVFHLPQGRRYRGFGQPRSARAHARDHQRQGTHLVRFIYSLSYTVVTVRRKQDISRSAERS